MRVSPTFQTVVCLWLLSVIAPACRATEGRQLPPNTPLSKPGDFIWTPEASTTGEISIIVDLPKQALHVYRGATRIGSSTISSGGRGRPSPPGVYTILEKQIFHRSNLYQNAPMPFMQRLGWDGFAIHAGVLPGYPASHGCVRLPHTFAELLYQQTKCGLSVIVANVPEERPRALPPKKEKLELLYSTEPKSDLKKLLIGLMGPVGPMGDS